MSSEDMKIFLEDLVDFVDGVEACCVKLRKQIEKLLGSNVKAKISEETFSVLKWQNEKGSRLGDYEVAYKNQNVLRIGNIVLTFLSRIMRLLVIPSIWKDTNITIGFFLRSMVIGFSAKS